ncbi:MAG: sulfite exporter TauE/SafE family protein [Actinobacteria bacterium]|nr:sulfite exporter TauE/SafE family protein [Actinomycetota bacterium]
MPRLVIIGLVAGVFSALFGVGGGIVTVPLLIALAAVPARCATGTSLAAIGITALAGTIFYASEGELHVGYALLVGLPAVVGVLIGTALQQRLPIRALSLGFAALLAGLGLWLLLGGDGESAATAIDLDALAVAAALGAGLAAGALSGLFGVGGGILFVPVLVALGLGQLEAEATSLLAVLPTVAVGAWRQYGYGNVLPRTAIVVGLTSVLGVWAGVALATAADELLLRRLFGLLLLGVAAQFAWRCRRSTAYAPGHERSGNE